MPVSEMIVTLGLPPFSEVLCAKCTELFWLSLSIRTMLGVWLYPNAFATSLATAHHSPLCQTKRISWPFHFSVLMFMIHRLLIRLGCGSRNQFLRFDRNHTFRVVDCQKKFLEQTTHNNLRFGP